MIAQKVITRGRRQLLFTILLLLLFSVVFLVADAARNSKNSPFSVLRVSSDADDDEIKRSYRKLCLKYHPDKNVQHSDRERKKCEEKFKEVQSAYDTIGTASKRRDYELQQAFGGMGTGSSIGSAAAASSSSPFANYGFDENVQRRYNRTYDDIPRRRSSYYSSPRGARYRSTSPPSPRDFLNMFFRMPTPAPSSSSSNGLFPMLFGGTKLIFVEKVPVPLDVLYEGDAHYDFELQTHDLYGSNNVDSSDARGKKNALRVVGWWWQLYRAAFRGGVVWPTLLQAFSWIVPVVRTLRFVLQLPQQLSFLCGLVGTAFVFHKLLPRPTRTKFHAPIKAGYKGGTKLTFSNKMENPGIDAIFVLEEMPHETYTRVGNDLCATLTISAAEARSGCIKTLKPISSSHMNTKSKWRRKNRFSSSSSSTESTLITITLKPNQILSSGQRVNLKGYGWPLKRRRRSGLGSVQDRGDLIVTFNLQETENKTKEEWEENKTKEAEE